MLGKGEFVLVCLFCLGNGRQIHSQQTPASSCLLLDKEQPLTALLLTLTPVVRPCHSPSRKSALAHDTRTPKLTHRQSRGVNLVLTKPRPSRNIVIAKPSEDVIATVNNWFEDLRQKMSGRAAFASLVAETIVFWIVFLIPAAIALYHQSTGIWMPDRSDPEAWGSFMGLLGGCYVFCKIPPIEAARWAWVFAWTPWFQEKFFSDEAVAESKDPSER